MEVIGECGERSVFSISIDSPTVQPLRINAGRLAVPIRSTILLGTVCLKCLLISSYLQTCVSESSSCANQGWNWRGLLCTPPLKILDTGGSWDIKGTTKPISMLFQNCLVTEKIIWVYLMIFEYHLCVIIFLNTQNTTESAKQIYIAWQTFISWMTLNMKLFSLTNRITVTEQILRWQ